MAELFNITHNTGDLSEYDSTVTDGGDLSVAAGAALAGTTYGLSCLIDGTGAIYGQKAVASPASNELRFRFYVDPNGLVMAEDDSFLLVSFNNDTYLLSVHLRKYITGGSFWVVTWAADDADNWYDLGFYELTDAPHYIEIAVVAAAGTGYVTQYVDGVQTGTKTGLDNNTQMDNITYVRFGAGGSIDAGTSGTFYLDEFKMTDDADVVIGPVAAMSPLRLRAIEKY